MYGALIGDIVGSKYEFNNIRTKRFPLFSRGCDYTDDTIMTAAVAKAIMLSREERYKQNDGGRSFRDILIETMRDFGRRYPHPTGAYGGRFAAWLRQDDPKPYGSYGNGSAMRASPCGLAAVTLEEAQALARASASVTHNHPEGIKGAEAVAAAVFLAKTGKSKAEIGRYVSEHYYALDFTLDSIRSTYRFDGSCQGSVPQAMVAFLESESFEDAIRNVISIGGDCDTTGTITGSIAWAYYAVQTGGYSGWVFNEFAPPMLEIRAQAMAYLPEEFIRIADEFHEVCWRRYGTHGRMGGCTPVLNQAEWKQYGEDWGAPAASPGQAAGDRAAGAKYDLAYVMARENRPEASAPGACSARYDRSEHKWRLRIQLDEQRVWFLSVFVFDDGRLDKYSLDEETASDSHYEFREERGIREKLYVPGDEHRYLHEILIRYANQCGAWALRSLVMPYVTAQFHY